MSSSMISDLKPYPEYEESEVPWLERIPSEWEIFPGMARIRQKKIKNVGMKQSTVLSLSYGRIIVKAPEKLHGLVPESFETYQIVRPGDIIIRGTDLQNDKTSLRVGRVDDDGIITSAYLCLETIDEASPQYIHLLLHTYDLLKIYYGMGSGLRQNLDYSDFKRLPILVPPVDEQEQIVRFLRSAEGRMNRLIRNKRRLIGLLREQKQGIINQAVTRGIDPNVPLKPSGIPWLDDIPEHWEVARSGRLFYEVVDTGYQDAELLSIVADIGIVRQSDTGRKTRASEDRSAYKRIRPGYLGYNLMNAFSGAIGVSEYDGVLSPAYAVARPRVPMNVWFYHRLYQTPLYKMVIDQHSYGIMYERNRLYFERFKLIPVPYPPPDEQEEILAFIDDESKTIDTAISRAESEIELMNEYRTRLIADVVTGKVDVRDVELDGLSGQDEFDEGDLCADEVALDESHESLGVDG